MAVYIRLVSYWYRPHSNQNNQFFKKEYPDQNFIRTYFLDDDINLQVYAVISTKHPQVKGGGKWNYFKFYTLEERIEEFEVKPGEKYWKAPTA